VLLFPPALPDAGLVNAAFTEVAVITAQLGLKDFRVVCSKKRPQTTLPSEEPHTKTQKRVDKQGEGKKRKKLSMRPGG